jgi:hypothetical protein
MRAPYQFAGIIIFYIQEHHSVHRVFRVKPKGKTPKALANFSPGKAAKEYAEGVG